LKNPRLRGKRDFKAAAQKYPQATATKTRNWPCAQKDFMLVFGDSFTNAGYITPNFI
jgi:hypothetical protein